MKWWRNKKVLLVISLATIAVTSLMMPHTAYAESKCWRANSDKSDVEESAMPGSGRNKPQENCNGSFDCWGERDDCKAQLGVKTDTGANDTGNTTGGDGGEDDKKDDEEGNDDSSSDDQCESQFFGLGWITCPLAKLVNGGIQGFASWISNKFETNILLGDELDSIRSVLNQMTAYANIALVFIFIIMIYSMATSATSFGFSNYHVKVILPRLIVVGIAVNLSFYICAFMVDISNMLGHGMYKLICADTLCDAMEAAKQSDVFNNITNNAIGNIVVMVIAFLIFGGAALVAFFVIIACVSFRDIALSVLIMAAPIALLLYTLPNTQQWGRRWLNLFVQLLIVYPLFTGLFAVAKLLGSSMLNAAADNSATEGTPQFIVVLACDIAPVFGIIPLFQASGGLMATIANNTNRQLSPYGNKLTSGIRGVEKNNPLTRSAARGISNATGSLSARYGGHGFIGRNAGRISASMGDIANANNVAEQGIKKRLEDAASTRVDNMEHGDVIGALQTNKFHGKKLDSFTLDALLDNAKDKASNDEWGVILAAAQANAASMKDNKEAEDYLKKFQKAANGSNKFYGKIDKGYTKGTVAYDQSAAMVAAANDISEQSLASAPAKKIEALNSAVQSSGNAKTIQDFGAKASTVLENGELNRNLSGEQRGALKSAIDAANKSAQAAQGIAGGGGGASPAAGGTPVQTGGDAPTAAPATESSGNSPQPGGSTPAPQPQRFSATSNTGARMIVNNVRSTQSAVAGNVANYQDNNFGGRFANNEAVQNMARDENAYIDYVNNTLSGSDSNLDASTRQQVYNTQDEIMGRGREGESKQ